MFGDWVALRIVGKREREDREKNSPLALFVADDLLEAEVRVLQSKEERKSR